MVCSSVWPQDTGDEDLAGLVRAQQPVTAEKVQAGREHLQH